jgi:hypothetical protein
MAHESWRYPPELLDALAAHGLAPRPTTPPRLVRAAVNDLYRYELRRLRLQYLRGEIDKAALHARVVASRKRYWVLSLPTEAWERLSTTDAGGGSGVNG